MATASTKYLVAITNACPTCGKNTGTNAPMGEFVHLLCPHCDRLLYGKFNESGIPVWADWCNYMSEVSKAECEHAADSDNI